MRLSNLIGCKLTTFIIFSRVRPPKIAQSATLFDCKYCVFSDLCHNNAVPSKNCRSCVRAVPIDGGKWGCEHFNQIIPDDVIKVGCANWTRIA